VDILGFVHTPARIPVDQNVLQMHWDAIEAERQLAYAKTREAQYHVQDPHAAYFAAR